MFILIYAALWQVGIVASYTQNDWTTDMKLAQAMGIDGFALNIGKSKLRSCAYLTVLTWIIRQGLVQ